VKKPRFFKLLRKQGFLTPRWLQLGAGREISADTKQIVVAVYLFGSYPRGEADHLSDLYIALLLRPDLPCEAMGRLGLRLDIEVCDLLGTEDVDVIVLNTAPLEAQEVSI
jgi:predicted nucleotidyltransferase